MNRQGASYWRSFKIICSELVFYLVLNAIPFQRQTKDIWFLLELMLYLSTTLAAKKDKSIIFVRGGKGFFYKSVSIHAFFYIPIKRTLKYVYQVSCDE